MWPFGAEDSCFKPLPRDSRAASFNHREGKVQAGHWCAELTFTCSERVCVYQPQTPQAGKTREISTRAVKTSKNGEKNRTFGCQTLRKSGCLGRMEPPGCIYPISCSLIIPHLCSLHLSTYPFSSQNKLTYLRTSRKLQLVGSLKSSQMNSQEVTAMSPGREHVPNPKERNWQPGCLRLPLPGYLKH
jgi:hypothetical protein